MRMQLENLDVRAELWESDAAMTAIEGKGILIIEDDPRNATLMRAMLSITGISNTRVCHSVQELYDAVEQMPQIDLVMLDLQLPGEDGYLLFKRLRTLPQLKNVPIVAVTAQVMPHEVMRAEMTGFDGFLGKPL